MEKQRFMFPLLPASEQEKMQAEVTSEKGQDGVNSGSGELLQHSKLSSTSSSEQQTCVSQLLQLWHEPDHSIIDTQGINLQGCSQCHQVVFLCMEPW